MCPEALGAVPTWDETQRRLRGRAVGETELWSPASRIWMVQSKYEMWRFLQVKALLCVSCRVLSHISHVRFFVTPSTVPPRLLCPSDSPGGNTGAGCRALLQGAFLTRGSSPRLLHLLGAGGPLTCRATGWQSLCYHTCQFKE